MDRKTVVLIDSDAVGRTELADWLRELGCHVTEVDNGDAGLALAMDKQPDIVFCDVLSPGCNGFQMCRILRGRPDAAPGVRIILTTVSDYHVHRETAADAGADDYLVKPITKLEFHEFFQRFLRNGNTTEFLSAEKRPSSDLRQGDGESVRRGASPPRRNEGQVLGRAGARFQRRDGRR